MAVTIPTLPNQTALDAVGLGQTIYADGSVTSGTAGDAAPDTWQSVAEDLNHAYAASPMCLASYASSATANDLQCGTTESSVASWVVRVPSGYTDVRLSTLGREAAASGTLTVRLRDGGSTIVTNTHTTTSTTSDTQTGSLGGTGERTLLLTVETASGTGYLSAFVVEFVGIAAGSIP